MPGVLVNEWLHFSQVVGYTISTVIVVLLFALVGRAARFNDTRPYLLLLWSAFLWNAANLASSFLVLTGLGPQHGPCGLSAVAYTGAAFAPAGALITWRRVDPRSADAARMGAWLVRLSLAVGGLLALARWDGWLRNGPLFSDRVFSLTIAAHVSVFFAAGAIVFYKAHLTNRAGRVCITMTVLGALAVGLIEALKSIRPAGGPASLTLAVSAQMATHVMTLGAMFYFARFRLADVFIRQSLRMIAAAAIGVVCMIVLASPVLSTIGIATIRGRAVTMTVGALLIAAVIVSFAVIDHLIAVLVDRRLFQQPDYHAALHRLRHVLASERDDEALRAATVEAVRQTLAPADARVIAIADLTPRVLEMLAHSDVTEDPGSRIAGGARSHPHPIFAAIRTGGTITGALSITPRPDHPTLLSREVEFVSAVRTALGHRLDLISREREAIERHTREALLQQQVSEATLRALQAQINPHFLFNTLNTIAHLIHEAPARAEAMTLRLAEIFDRVLRRSHHPFSSVGEEMDFLRTYLTIEEARFGDRLSVAFAIDPEAAHLTIPSLILQPAVENALKHGIGRTVGLGQVTISAAVDGACLTLSVEDNGAGPRPAAPVALQSGGIGLRNIAERLHTMYHGQASLHFGPRPVGGSVVTIRLPAHQHDQKPAH